MNRRRTTTRTLTGTRIFVRYGRYKFFSAEAILNPTTGKVSKWHTLCLVEEGEARAREILAKLLDHIEQPKGRGDFCAWFGKWRAEIFKKREADAPRDPARTQIWERGNKALINVLNLIENAFADFDIAQVTPADVATFVDQWEGRRAAQLYRGHLSKFFGWCCRRGIMDRNPAREITVATPKKRKVYFDNQQYIDVKAAMLDSGGHNNEMIAALMDLYYLFYQRGTDVRLLRVNDLDGDNIKITPTKTENSSGASVRIPISQEARSVLERIKRIAKLRSIYLIHDEYGQPFTARKAYDIFKQACKRAGVSGVTLKDIRAMAATDAKSLGYTESQIQTALAHTDGSTTRDYIRSRDVPVSEVILTLPK